MIEPLRPVAGPDVRHAGVSGGLMVSGGLVSA
jgi:hypothetical protein